VLVGDATGVLEELALAPSPKTPVAVLGGGQRPPKAAEQSLGSPAPRLWWSQHPSGL